LVGVGLTVLALLPRRPGAPGLAVGTEHAAHYDSCPQDPLLQAKDLVLHMAGPGDFFRGGGPRGGRSSRGPDPASLLPTLYPQRWVQLGYISLFSLISSWVCFSAVTSLDTFSQVTGHEFSELVTLFFVANVASCFLYTDVTRFIGLRGSVIGAAVVMSTGCLLRSGIPFVGGLPPFPALQLGTLLVGAAQPFFRCSPALLSATWFGAQERTTATATALNFNQLGIALAFLLGGTLGDTPDGLAQYFSIITVAAYAVTVGSVIQFKERPPSPPSASAVIREVQQDARALQGPKQFAWTFPEAAADLFAKGPVFAPLAAFVASYGVTNIIATFTDSSLRRAGFLQDLDIDLSGAAFQLAIVLGSIAIGGYVDRTKQFKRTTMFCLNVGGLFLTVMSLAFGNGVTLPPAVIVVALLGVGATLGAVQPVNAELAVETTYPSDENAVAAVQQLSGSFFTALLIPLVELTSQFDIDFFDRVKLPIDTVVVLCLLLATSLYYLTFTPRLRRSDLDSALPLSDRL
jgi:hypothetical protein